MKYRLLSLFSILIAFIVGLVAIHNGNSTIQELFPRIGSLVLKGVVFLTSVMMLTSLCVSCNRLSRVKKMGKTLRYFFLSAISIYFVFQILALLVSKISFLPSDQVPDMSRIQSSLSTFKLSVGVWDDMQNISGVFAKFFTFLKLSSQHYLAWFALACGVGFIMLHDIEVAEPSYNLIDSVSRLFFRLLQKIYSLLTIYLIFYIIYTLFQIRGNTLLGFYSGFFLRLTTITVLLFICTILVLYFVYKEKKPYLFLSQTFLSIFSSFLTGSAIFSISVLAVEQKNHLGTSRDNTGLLNPLNFLFLRPGSAIVLAYSFMTYYSSNTRWQLNFFPQLLWLILVPIGFAMIIGLFSIPSYSMILPFYFVSFGLGTTDTFIIMAPVLLLGQSFASCIDALSWNFSNYLHKQFYNFENK